MKSLSFIRIFTINYDPPYFFLTSISQKKRAMWLLSQLLGSVEVVWLTWSSVSKTQKLAGFLSVSSLARAL